MVEKKKKQAGVETPANLIQDMYEATLATLNKERQWLVDFKAKSKTAGDQIAKDMGQLLELGERDKAMQFAQMLLQTTTVSLITDLGIKLAETHQRLAQVEKAVKEVKAAL